MKDLQPDLIDVYIKRAHGVALNEAESKLWESYKVLYPLEVEALFDNDETMTELARQERKMPSFAKFYERYKVPFTIAFPEEKKTATVQAIRTPHRKRIVLAVAASLLLLVLVGYWLYRPDTKSDAVVGHTDDRLEITPGYDQATLTLADGKEIKVDTTIEGVLAQQQIATVRVTEPGTLSYQPLNNHPSGTIPDNTLSTPLGGTYHLILADGTNVWLNAGSKLTYPVVFGAAKREVELEGEAYFEVAHQANRPFRVRYQQQVVEDLGTAFNVQAYRKDSNTVVLVQGKVRVSEGATMRELKPGEAALNYQNQLTISTVSNIQDVTGWKNRYFSFHDTRLSDIMSQVQRWYDVSIVYADPVADERFVVNQFPREYPLKLLLDNLAATGRIHYRIKGRTVLISK